MTIRLTSSNFLADKSFERCQGNVVIVTREDGAMCVQLISLEEMVPVPCNQEEADSQLFLHARYSVE